MKKNIIDCVEFEIFDNEPNPSSRGVEYQIVSILEQGDSVVESRFNYKIGKYENISFSKETFMKLRGIEDVTRKSKKEGTTINGVENVIKMGRKQTDNILPAGVIGHEYGNLWVFEIGLKEKGNQKPKHKHEFDHLHLIVKGSALFEVYDKDNNIIFTDTYTAPQWIKIPKMHDHQITALEDDTIGYCIHPMRNEDDDLIDSNYIEDILSDYKHTPSTDLKEV